MNATPDKEPCKRSSTRSRRRMTAAEAHVEERYAKKRREIAEAREAKEREADQAVEATLIAAAQERLRSATGDMPEVKEWREGRVAYKGQWVTHDGSVWQARKDTGQTPTGRIGGASLAAAGRARDVRAR